MALSSPRLSATFTETKVLCRTSSCPPKSPTWEKIQMLDGFIAQDSTYNIFRIETPELDKLLKPPVDQRGLYKAAGLSVSRSALRRVNEIY